MLPFRVLVCGLLLCCAGAHESARAEKRATNLDFEQGDAGEVPPGWRAQSAIRRGYSVALGVATPHGGRACVVISRDSSVYNDYGPISQMIDATPFRGQRVLFRGWLRYRGETLGGMHLWLRVDRPSQQTGFFDNMYDRPVRAWEWTEVRIVGEVAADADSIVFGAMLSGDGTGQADDLVLEALGPIGEGDRPPRPVSERGLENLIAFTRLLGYVRHFHPSDESAAADWDAVALAGVNEVEGARTAQELAAALERVFRPIAPTLRLGTRPLPPLDPRALAPPGAMPTHVTGWYHFGWRGTATQSHYWSQRPRVPIGAPGDSVLAIGTTKDADLGGGVWCSVPLTLHADSTGTLPRGGPLPRPPWSENWMPTGNDRTTRLASIALIWNIAQHFYSYFDVVDTDWKAQLPIALRAAATDRDELAYSATLDRLIAALCDGHGNVVSPVKDRRIVPLTWALVDGRLVVLEAHESVAGRIRRGDEVTAIDGRPTTEWVAEVQAKVSGATPQFVRTRTEGELARIGRRDSVTLDLRSPDGAARRERVERGWLRPARPDSIAEPAPGIVYVDLDRFKDTDFLRELPRLERARGLIFDLRGYPAVSPLVVAHLIDSTITCARWHVPLVRRPDREGMEFGFSNWPVPPRGPRLKARAAFLIDGRAISYAETFLGIVEHYRLAELVGEATAGTNGNIVQQRLPGNYRVIFTGMKVLKHDGSRHHGIGIRPTVAVTPTVAGIAAGRDEQLEKAIEVVSRVP